MFRFLIPFSDMTVWDVAIGAIDLEAAVDEYKRFWWNPCTPGAIAVFHNQCLAGRILPILNEETGENEPLFQPWP
jgi:hypothetical protein